MTCIDFWIDTKHAGNIRGFDEALVQKLLPIVIELIGNNSPFNSECIIASFPNYPIDHFGIPPDTFISEKVPFL